MINRAVLSSLMVLCLMAGGAWGAGQRPNILLIVADDLGYSDLGAFGSEIETPNLDQLAYQGVRFTNYNIHFNCAPSRAMLLSGVDPHLAGLGVMARYETGEQRGRPGYETHLNQQVVTFASVLRDAGYHTYMAGKWHMGGKPELLPDQRGFEKSFVLVQGGGHHFSRRGYSRDVDPVDYRENGQEVELPENFYSTKTYTDKLIEYIGSEIKDDKPFLAFASYTAPHWPLQAPDEFIAKYQSVYDDGYQVIAENRLAKMRSLGLLEPEIAAAPQHDVWPAWSELSAAQQRLESRRMQVYAAMVDAMDHHVGRLLDYLKSERVLDNTVVIFMSDNGPEGNNPMDIRGNHLWVPSQFDTGVENMGRPGSWAWTGPGWAHVSATPFRLYKWFPTAGGIRSPLIIKLPGSQSLGRISSGFTTAMDITPTLLELGNTAHPGRRYKNRDVYPLQGSSLLPHLNDARVAVHDETYAVGWELFNRRALVKGPWKLVSMNAPWGEGEGVWSLFNLAKDPTELTDVSALHPGKMKEMLAEWRAYVAANNVVELEHFEVRFSNQLDHYDYGNNE